MKLNHDVYVKMTEEEKKSLIRIYFKCGYADIDNKGNIWIQYPMKSHILNEQEIKAFEQWFILTFRR
jgi:hypothetical protein